MKTKLNILKMSQGLLIILCVTLTIFGSVWNSGCVCIHLQVLISHGKILERASIKP